MPDTRPTVKLNRRAQLVLELLQAHEPLAAGGPTDAVMYLLNRWYHQEGWKYQPVVQQEPASEPDK